MPGAARRVGCQFAGCWSSWRVVRDRRRRSPHCDAPGKGAQALQVDKGRRLEHNESDMHSIFGCKAVGLITFDSRADDDRRRQASRRLRDGEEQLVSFASRVDDDDGSFEEDSVVRVSDRQQISRMPDGDRRRDLDDRTAAPAERQLLGPPNAQSSRGVLQRALTV